MKESPGIANPKGYPNGRQTELVPRRPQENPNKDPSGSNSEAPAKAKRNPQKGISFEFHAQVRSEQATRNLFPFVARSDRNWAWNSKDIPFWGFLFAFDGASELLPLGSLLGFSCGRLGNNSVWHPFGSPLGFAIPGDSFSGIPPFFPLLGFTLIIRLRGTTFSPVGGLLLFSFLGKLHQSLNDRLPTFPSTQPLSTYIC